MFVDITKDLDVCEWNFDRRPSWDIDGGKWYSVPAMDPKAKHIRYKPRIETVCTPLLGSITTPEERKRACEAYLEGMELVKVFRSVDDLLKLPFYRWYLSGETNIRFDITLFDLAKNIGSETPSGKLAKPQPLTKDQWHCLAMHMPPDSWIRNECIQRYEGAI